jgi:hypothetical protein
MILILSGEAKKAAFDDFSFQGNVPVNDVYCISIC